MKYKNGSVLGFVVSLIVFVFAITSIIYIGILLAKGISIKSLLGLLFDFWFNFFIISSGFGALISSGIAAFHFGSEGKYLKSPLFEDDLAMVSLFYPISIGWLVLNVLIPYVYLYDIEPWIPQQKFHYIISNIPQILDSNPGFIISFSIYFLSAVPFSLILGIFLSTFLNYFKISKKNTDEADENPISPNKNSIFYRLLENFTIWLFIFEIIYFFVHFTYPTFVYLLNN